MNKSEILVLLLFMGILGSAIAVIFFGPAIALLTITLLLFTFWFDGWQFKRRTDPH